MLQGPLKSELAVPASQPELTKTACTPIPKKAPSKSCAPTEQTVIKPFIHDEVDETSSLTQELHKEVADVIQTMIDENDFSPKKIHAKISSNIGLKSDDEEEITKNLTSTCDIWASLDDPPPRPKKPTPSLDFDETQSDCSDIVPSLIGCFETNTFEYKSKDELVTPNAEMSDSEPGISFVKLLRPTSPLPHRTNSVAPSETCTSPPRRRSKRNRTPVQTYNISVLSRYWCKCWLFYLSFRQSVEPRASSCPSKSGTKIVSVSVLKRWYFRKEDEAQAGRLELNGAKIRHTELEKERVRVLDISNS